MKVYVASKFENTGPVRELMKSLKEQGFEITHDWTVHEGAEEIQQEKDLIPFLTNCAMEDFYGVVSADALVLLNHPNCKGAFTELGIALALSKPVLVLDHDLCKNIFFFLPGVRLVKSINEVFDILHNQRRLVEIVRSQA